MFVCATAYSFTPTSLLKQQEAGGSLGAGKEAKQGCLTPRLPSYPCPAVTPASCRLGGLTTPVPVGLGAPGPFPEALPRFL